MISPLAIPAERFGHAMFTDRRQRSLPVYGVTLHTTGSGLLDKTAKTTNATLTEAARIYTDSGGPHYVIGWDGTIVANVADERIRGAHAGIEDEDARRRYHDDTWQERMSPLGYQMWRMRWAPARTPVDLIPTRTLSDINDLWIGVEMIPVTDGKVLWAMPMRKGLRFTRAQHDAARALVDDIGRRHGLPRDWKRRGGTRLIGHSDINPIERNSPSLPLWDPGYPYAFDMDHVRRERIAPALVIPLFMAIGFGFSYWTIQRARR